MEERQEIEQEVQQEVTTNESNENVETVHNIVDNSNKEVKQVEEEKEPTIGGMNFMAEIQELKQFFENEINALKQEITQQKQQLNTQVEQKILDLEQDKTIDEFLASKPLINDFTRGGLKQQIITALSDEAYKGRPISEVYEQVTNGLNDIYKNPNPVVIQQGSNVDIGALDIYENQRKIYQALGVQTQ